jgi:ABC-type dipeptide/oligopeptide/nickel transport system permease subunit
LGTIIVFIFIGMVLLAPLIARYSLNSKIPSMLHGPSQEHWLGTDHLGRDLWARIIYGARIALGLPFLRFLLHYWAVLSSVCWLVL